MLGIFRHMDYDVVTAGTVSEGLAALDPPPYCVLLDLTLPDGPGEQILERIRARKLPSRVVVCTGECDPARLDDVRRFQPEAILTKPLALSDLVTACRIPPHLRSGFSPQ